MTILVNKLSCNLQLGKLLIKAGSSIELAEDEAKKLIELHPDKVRLKYKTRNKRKNDNNNNS